VLSTHLHLTQAGTDAIAGRIGPVIMFQMTAVAPRPPVEGDARLYTAADLAVLPSDLPSGSVRYELDNGRLVSLRPNTDEHGAVVSALGSAIHRLSQSTCPGKARIGGVGLILWRNPDRIVGADVAFIASTSLPIRRSSEGYLETIPDLVAEVVSKNDTGPYVQRKVDDYLAAGVRMVLIADPGRRTVTLHRPAAAPLVLTEADTLTLEEIIPGFHLPVRDVFAE
jgi:Uma2 family endonuclease